MMTKSIICLLVVIFLLMGLVPAWAETDKYDLIVNDDYLHFTNLDIKKEGNYYKVQIKGGADTLPLIWIANIAELDKSNFNKKYMEGDISQASPGVIYDRTTNDYGLIHYTGDYNFGGGIDGLVDFLEFDITGWIMSNWGIALKTDNSIYIPADREGIYIVRIFNGMTPSVPPEDIKFIKKLPGGTDLHLKAQDINNFNLVLDFLSIVLDFKSLKKIPSGDAESLNITKDLLLETIKESQKELASSDALEYPLKYTTIIIEKFGKKLIDKMLEQGKNEYITDLKNYFDSKDEIMRKVGVYEFDHFLDVVNKLSIIPKSAKLIQKIETMNYQETAMETAFIKVSKREMWIELLGPESETVTSDSQIKVRGFVHCSNISLIPGKKINITVNNKNYKTDVYDNGAFHQIVELAPGKNKIEISISSLELGIVSLAIYVERISSDDVFLGNLLTKDIVPGKSVGGLNLGTSVKEIMKMMGEPDKIEHFENEEKNNPRFMYHYYKDKKQKYWITLGIKDDILRIIFVFDKSFVAPGEIKVGSSAMKIQEKYKDQIDKKYYFIERKTKYARGNDMILLPRIGIGFLVKSNANVWEGIITNIVIVEPLPSWTQPTQTQNSTITPTPTLPTSADYFPLSTGWKWNYKQTKTAPNGTKTYETYEITNSVGTFLNKSVIIQRTQESNGSIYEHYFQDGIAALTLIGYKYIDNDNNTRFMYEPMSAWLIHPLAINSTWKDNYKIIDLSTGNITTTVNSDRTVVAKENVNVNAENFSNCYKIKWNGRLAYTGASVSTCTQYDWYAPNVGLVKSTCSTIVYSKEYVVETVLTGYTTSSSQKFGDTNFGYFEGNRANATFNFHRNPYLIKDFYSFLFPKK